MSPDDLRTLIRAAVLAMPLAGCAQAAPPPPVNGQATEAEAEASEVAESDVDEEPEAAPADPDDQSAPAAATDGEMSADEFDRRWRDSTRGSQPGSGPAIPVELTMPGRPLMIAGRARVASLEVGRSRIAWGELGAELEPACRAAVAAAWASAGQAEHASVASFLRAARELHAVGAPSHLVDAHRRAAREEVAHARDAFAIAAAYGAEATRPGALPEARVRGGGIARVARDVLCEGCIGETASALAAERALRLAQPRPVRAALRTAAREEASHAALAFSTLRWAASVEPCVREVIAAELERDRERCRGLAAAAPSRDLCAHGVLGEAAILECRAVATERVVAPLVRSI